MESREAATTKRTDIQLWRGVAVLAVMLAHFGSLVPAGFIGVDLFFAISGFVITLSFLRLLSREKSIKTVLVEFWSRRFWRLVPALSIVLVATLLGAFLLLPPHDFRDQVEMSVWSFFFAGNIGVEVVSRPNYFDPAAKHNWLLHLWSLGVEEQFYLLFPFALLALLGLERKTGKFSRVVLWLLLASVASLLLASVNEVVEWLGVFPWVVETTGLSALLGYYLSDHEGVAIWPRYLCSTPSYEKDCCSTSLAHLARRLAPCCFPGGDAPIKPAPRPNHAPSDGGHLSPSALADSSQGCQLFFAETPGVAR